MSGRLSVVSFQQSVYCCVRRHGGTRATKRLLAAFLVVLCFAAGCGNQKTDGQPLDLYFESWKSISFHVPSITDNGYAKEHNKTEAETIIKAHCNTVPPSANVMFSKALGMNERFATNIDEVQAWLVSLGVKEITFRLAFCDGPPPVVREYRNGKVIVSEMK